MPGYKIQKYKNTKKFFFFFFFFFLSFLFFLSFFFFLFLSLPSLPFPPAWWVGGCLCPSTAFRLAFPFRATRCRVIGLDPSVDFVVSYPVPIAAQIADRFGWRRAFLFFAGLAVVTTLATLRLPRERLNPQPSTEKLRTALEAFRSFLARRDTAAALVIAFLVSGGLVGFLTYIGEWLNSSFGLPTRTIGWVFMLGGIVAVGSAPLGGILSDRWGKRAISIASNIVLMLAVALCPLLPWGLGLLGVFALASLGAAFRQGPLTALMTEMVPAAQRGSFIALRNISSQMGIGVTAYLGGVLFQKSGYAAVTTLCAVMTTAVVILLATHIVEPHGAEESARSEGI